MLQKYALKVETFETKFELLVYFLNEEGQCLCTDLCMLLLFISHGSNLFHYL